MERYIFIFSRQGDVGENGSLLSTNLSHDGVPGTQMAHKKD
jgi:hypothetical protein